MVALIILGLAFGAYMLSLTRVTQNQVTLFNKTISALIASNVMTQIRIGEIILEQTASKQQELIMVNRRWYWQAQSIATDNQKIREIRVNVSNEAKETLYELKGYVCVDNQ